MNSAAEALHKVAIDPHKTLTVVVPCYNEADNVAPMVAALDAALAGVAWEVVFVDDNSPDGTARTVQEIARKDPRVRCIRRIGRRGLSSAVVEGALSSSADYVAVIDGDLQHDESRLPLMLAAVQGGADIAVGSRYTAGGDSAGLSSPFRTWLSNAGTRLANLAAHTKIGDPMSGFFLLSRDLFERLAPRLASQGYKILLDLMLTSTAKLNVAEVPYTFRSRTAGESKLDTLVLAQFAGLLIEHMFRGAVPLRFISFALVGALGIIVNLLVFQITRAAGADFVAAQTAGTIAAMVGNFLVNNQLTYRAQRLNGAKAWQGLALFMIVCSVGSAANIGIAQVIYIKNGGEILAGAIGAAIGVVWNYAVSSTLVWRDR